MKNQIRIALQFLLATAVILPALVEAQELSVDGGLPSPYFIDEVHCSGINIYDIQEGWLLSADEVEPARKIEQAEMCERILRVFGIEKYQWLSPDDLERTSTMIRQSGYFQDAELSVQKSELKNHVHVFLKVKPAGQYSQSISDDFRYYGSRNQGSSRITDFFNAEISNDKYLPVSSHAFGINVMNTSASSPPFVGDSTFVTTDDLQKLSLADAYLVELYWKNHGNASKHWSWDFGMQLSEDNVYSDNKSRLNLQTSADVLYTRPVNNVHGSLFFGPAFLTTSYEPYQIPDVENSTKSVFLPGVIFGYNYGQDFGNKLKFKLAYYHAAEDFDIFQMDFEAQKHVDLLNAYLIFAFYEREVSNGVLPEDRFPLSSPLATNDYIGIGKVIHGAESNQEIQAVYGFESLQYNDETPTYQGDSSYVGLKYKIVDGTWDINLAASYYFQRIF